MPRMTRKSSGSKNGNKSPSQRQGAGPGPTGARGPRQGGPKQGGPKSGGAKPGGPRGPRGGGPKRPGWMPEPLARGAKPAQPNPQGGYVDPYADREAARYEQPIASRETILQVLAAADGPMPAEALAEKLALSAPDRFDALSNRLRAMLRDGQLLQNRRGEFVPAAQLDLVPGVVIANPDGFGFLRPEAGGGDDLFLPPFEMRKVMHGDRVLASVTGVDRRGRREGAIVEVLERRLNRLIGRYTVEAGISYVVPDDRRIQRNVQIPAESRGDAQSGQLVVVEIVHAPDTQRPPIGRVLTVLGDRLAASPGRKGVV